MFGWSNSCFEIKDMTQAPPLYCKSSNLQPCPLQTCVVPTQCPTLSEDAATTQHCLVSQELSICLCSCTAWFSRSRRASPVKSSFAVKQTSSLISVPVDEERAGSGPFLTAMQQVMTYRGRQLYNNASWFGSCCCWLPTDHPLMLHISCLRPWQALCCTFEYHSPTSYIHSESLVKRVAGMISYHVFWCCQF